MPFVQEHALTAAASDQSMMADIGASTTADSFPMQHASSSWQYEKGCWEAFHARDNATARFYKERRSVSVASLMALNSTHAVTHLIAELC